MSSSTELCAADESLNENKRERRGVAVPQLVLDISGTRGMLLRRKRSMSTGRRGLMPPGRQ